MNTKILLDNTETIMILYRKEQTIIQWKKQKLGNDKVEFIAIARFLIIMK